MAGDGDRSAAKDCGFRVETSQYGVGSDGSVDLDAHDGLDPRAQHEEGAHVQQMAALSEGLLARRSR